MPQSMLEQYHEIKSQHRDAILFFRLGDFYEMFGDDAREGSRLLGLTLTKRQNTPMCGVPHHAARTYIGRLLDAGRKVAICEQVGQVTGKGLAHREVVEVVSPGAIFDPDFLDPKLDNNILALGEEEGALALAWIDASVGELQLGSASFTDEESREAAIRSYLSRLSPREILVQESLLERSTTLADIYRSADTRVVNRIPDWGFDKTDSFRRLCARLDVVNLRGFGIEEGEVVLLGAATVLEYLEENARHVLEHLGGVRVDRSDAHVQMDEATIRNLELVANMRDGGRDYTLVDLLDTCRTAMGSRLLHRWILSPERDVAEIENRLDAVEQFYRAQSDLRSLRSLLADVYDLERLLGRLGVSRAHAKDLSAISMSIRTAREIDRLIPDWRSGPQTPGFMDGAEEWAELESLSELIDQTLADDPPISVTDGGVIRDGFDPDLDRLRRLRDHSKQILDSYLEEQRAATSIPGLRMRYNRVLGYFFEVAKSQADRLPERFIRRQSLANGERFTTERLGEIEIEISGARDSAIAREEALFTSLRENVGDHIPVLSKLAGRLGRLDVLAGFAQLATDRAYTRPELSNKSEIAIERGRHPVVEAYLPPGGFVPNDLTLGVDAQRFALLTGPNMAGKSTVLRQTALIALMTQIGSFVPAETAQIGLVDRIFCRVGASDNIARGESTFLVEMNETSNILRNAGRESLVIMDEVGRGTSTHDGLAIAWAICEFLLENVAARTLFATHYHELTAIEHISFTSLTMAVEHAKGRIVFLKRLIAGSADRSYGVDVARLAGIPELVLQRAAEILDSFERERLEVPESDKTPTTDASQSELFSDRDLVLTELGALDPDLISPRDALDIIFRWRSMLTQKK